MQPTIRINIGLETFEGKPVSFERVSAQLTQLGFQRTACRIEQSSTEPTLVWAGHAEGWNTERILSELNTVAHKFEQDCVAVMIDRPNVQVSALVGKKAKKWGAFDPKHFII